MKNLLQLSAVLVLAIVGLMGCSTPVTKKPDLVEVWPNVVRSIFRIEAEAPYLIVLVPEEGRTAGSDFPALIVPAGPSGFDRFTPLAFLPDDKPPVGGPAQGPAAPADSEDNGDADEDNPEEGAEEPEAEDDDEGSSFEDWPSVNELPWPPGSPDWPPIRPWPPASPPWPEPLDPDSVMEEDIDEMLDDALRRAFEDEEPPEEEEDGEEHPLEDRFWTPAIPPNLPSWWDPPEVPDIHPQPEDGPDLDFPLPRWKDLEPDMLPPPDWPLGEPWPHDDSFRLPERWRPDEEGFRLGDWRIYIVPLPGDGD